MLLRGARLSASATAELATGQAPERPRLQRQPGTGTTRVAYLAKLPDNKQVARYLKQRQPEVLAEFETIVQTVSLEQ